MTREWPFLATWKPELRQISRMLALCEGLASFVGGGDLSVKGGWTHSLENGLAPGCTQHCRRVGTTGNCTSFQNQHQESWPGAPVKGINIWKPML